MSVTPVSATTLTVNGCDPAATTPVCTRTRDRYCPIAMAAAAIGAEKPTTTDTHPARKPTTGW